MSQIGTVAASGSVTVFVNHASIQGQDRHLRFEEGRPLHAHAALGQICRGACCEPLGFFSSDGINL